MIYNVVIGLIILVLLFVCVGLACCRFNVSMVPNWDSLVQDYSGESDPYINNCINQIEVRMWGLVVD